MPPAASRSPNVASPAPARKSSSPASISPPASASSRPRSPDAAANGEFAVPGFARYPSLDGRTDRHRIEDVTPDYWDERMRVNLRHQFFAAQAVIPGMRKAGGGSIVNMGSSSWMTFTPELTVYMSAKSGVIGETRGMARDL